MKLYAEKLHGYTWCTRYREHDIPVSCGNRLSVPVARKVIVTKFIRSHVNQEKRCSLTDIHEYLEEKYLEIQGLRCNQAIQMAGEDAKLIGRYLFSERRKAASIPEKYDQVMSGETAVLVKPDLVFVEKAGRFSLEEGPVPRVEAVVFACKKPDVTQTGKGIDTGAKQNLHLYFLLLWAEKYAMQHGFPEGTALKASFYFLKKKNDRFTGFADPNFFNNKGAGNVVSLEYYLGNENDPLMIHFRNLFTRYMQGEAPDTGRCGYCAYHGICDAEAGMEESSLADDPAEQEKQPPSRRVPATDIVLTGPQADAVACREGTVRSNAGAGTGKTLMLAMRTAHMLMEGTVPSHICMLTFTNVAAKEMCERVRQYLDDFGCDADVDSMVCTTFDSFWYGIVKEHYSLLGFRRSPELLNDRTDRYMILSHLLDENPLPGLDYKNSTMRSPYYRGAYALAEDVIGLIKQFPDARNNKEKLKNLLQEKGLYGFIPENCPLEKFFMLYDAWQEELKQACLAEYADLPLMVKELLSMMPDLFEQFGFEHVMIDEYQDTDTLQFSLVSRLETCPSTKSFLVVGDDSQSIYGFRGSTPEHIIHFHEMMKNPGCDYNLLENHRSSGNIVRFANEINAKNKNRVDKNLIPTRDAGCPVYVNRFSNRDDEYGFIADEAEKLHDRGIPYRDMAFLAHNRSELLKMQEVLEERKIPCGITSPGPVLEDPGVRAAIALAKFARDPSDTESGYRAACMICGNGLDDGTAAGDVIWLDCELIRIKSMDKEFQTEAMTKFLEKAGSGNIYEEFLKKSGSKGSLEEMLEYMVCFEKYGENDTMRDSGPVHGMELTTAHSSKGREWPVVFDSISAYHKKDMDEMQKEETRRLVFVSVTRARNILYVTGQEIAYGGKNGVPNMFLEECLEAAGGHAGKGGS